VVYGLGIVLPRLLNYVLLTPFYTRVFERAAYGMITELYAYVVFLLVILTYGMETGYFRFASNTDRKETVYSTVLGSLFVSSSAFIILLYVFSGAVGSWLGYSEHPEYIRWLAMIVGIDAFTAIPFARIRLFNRAGKYAVIRIAEVSVNIGLNLFFLYYCPRHTESRLVEMIYREGTSVGYVLISNLIASVVKLLLLTGEIMAAFRSAVNLSLFRKVLGYSYPLLIAGLAGTVNEALDRILIKHLIPADQLPMEQLGIYGANFKLAVLMTLFVQMFKYAAEPFFFSRSADKHARVLYADVMIFFVGAGLIIFLLVNLYMDYFILFIGADFREGANIVPVILMANLVMGMFFNLSIWYKLTNKTIIGAILVILGASITIVINALFIPRYGYVASAWAHLICYSTMLVLSYLWSRKHYAIPYRTGRIIGYVALALLIYFVNKLFLQETGRSGDVSGLVMLLAFTTVFVLAERPTFLKYKYQS
jgi:O-antigen/teichoic acid export membrane protein